jgi:hypothetical protein
LLSVRFIMISSGGNESANFETRIQQSAPVRHKSAVNKQVEEQSVRLS